MAQLVNQQINAFPGNKIAKYNYHATKELVMLGPEAFGYKDKTTISSDSTVFGNKYSFGLKTKAASIFQKLNNAVAVALLLFSFPAVSFARNNNVVTQSSNSKTKTSVKSSKKESGKTSKSTSTVSKIAPKKVAPKISLNTKSNPKTVVDVVVKKDPQSGQLTKIGVVLVAGTVIGTLLLGDDKSTKKSDEKFTNKINSPVTNKAPISPPIKINAKKSPSKFNGNELFGDDSDELTPNRAIKESPVKSIRLSLIPETASTKSKGKALKKDLFDDDDDDNENNEDIEELVNDIEETKSTSTSSPSPQPPLPFLEQESIVKKSTSTTTPTSTKKSSSSSLDADEKATAVKPPSIPTTTTTIPPSPSSSPLPPPPAAPTEKKGLGIFNRLFPKQGAGRPTSLHAALAMEDTASEFRRSIATSLLPSLTDTTRDIFASDVDVDEESESSTIPVESLAQEWVDAGLTQSMAAEAFADVASSMLVILIDVAISQLGIPAPTPATTPTPTPADNTTSSVSPPPPVITTLNEVIALAGLAGELFPQVVGSTATLSTPVQYNGAAKRGKVEDLFYEYYKSSMSDISSLLMGGGGGASTTADDNSLNMQKLQVVLGIKEGRRNALEQKAMKDLLLSGGGGIGGLGDLSSMFEALAGGAKGNSKEMEAQLKSVMGAVSDSGIDSLEDLDKMSPDELADMSKSAVDSVKASLKDGSITKQDVIELEKIMGTDVESLVKMMKQSAAGALADKSVGGEVKEMLQLFSELLAIKKGNK